MILHEVKFETELAAIKFRLGTLEPRRAASRLTMTPPPIKHKALLNVDLGEAYGNFAGGPDDEIIPLIGESCTVDAQRRY